MDDIQLARYDRVFRAYAGEDDYLTRDCFTRHTRKLAEIRGEAADSPRVLAFDEELGGIWDYLASVADADHDGRVSLAEWRAASEGVTAALRETDATGAASPLDVWVNLLFRVIDDNEDRRISMQEYADWLQALDLLEGTDLESAFAGFDLNHDGTLSEDEFRTMYHQYWTNFDPTIPAHRWIGP